MKALFVSDNHGDRAILQKIAARFGNEVDIMLHCGDSNLEPSESAKQHFS
ncbi:metallophosphoesterase family protein [Limosilactobacillus mucosae]|nr:metallophosphoesterase family protein [Limosilactobacillus mucosae]